MMVATAFIISIMAYIIGIISIPFSICIIYDGYKRKNLIDILFGIILTFCGIMSIIIGYLAMV